MFPYQMKLLDLAVENQLRWSKDVFNLYLVSEFYDDSLDKLI